MALTVTRTGDWQHVAGNRRVANVTVAFDSSYVAGGESFTAADVGMRVIEKVQVHPDNGYYFEYDYTNSTIIAYQQSVGVVTTNTTSNPNTVTGSETALTSFSVPANTIAGATYGMRVTAWGQTGSTAGDVVLRPYFGGIRLSSSTLTGSLAWGWKSVYEIMRVTSGTMDTISQLVASSTSIVTSDVEFLLVSTLDFTAANTFQISANVPTGRFTVTQEGLIAELLCGPSSSAITASSGIEVPSTSDLSALSNVRVTVWGY